MFRLALTSGEAHRVGSYQQPVHSFHCLFLFIRSFYSEESNLDCSGCFTADTATLAPDTFYSQKMKGGVGKLANRVGLAQRGPSCCCALACVSASFPSFPDVGAPPRWPAAASHSSEAANSHSCYQSEDSHKEVCIDGPHKRKTQPQ